MLVARGEMPEGGFGDAAREAVRHGGSGTARMIRYELDGTAARLANEGTTGRHLRIGEPFQGQMPTGVIATVRRTGQSPPRDVLRVCSGCGLKRRCGPPCPVCVVIVLKRASV